MTDDWGLEGAYGATLSRIKGQGKEGSRLGMAALMWISHSERPLMVRELRDALGVEIGAAGLDVDNFPSIGTLLTCCQGLVSVGKGASTVRLIHLTLQEYLQAHAELFDRPQAAMAETCLSYLNSHQVKALSTSPSPDFRRGTPFLEYSSLYWGVHAKRDLSDCAKQLALKLFDDYTNHISTKILLSQKVRVYLDFNSRRLFLFSGLHCASFFGINELVTLLVEVEGCDLNGIDWTGSTPLVWAAKNGHEGVVKVLLGRGDVNPDKPSESGGTPLWWAALYGHMGVLKILLERDDVNPEQPLEDGQTPLYWATSNGHGGVVKILLERDDVNPEKQDINGQTPLSCAARNGHEGVVKILLGRDDVNPNKPELYGRTPLLCAAWNGHEGVVEVLLRRSDVNPDKPGIDGRTPLWCAALNGHEGVMKTLLGRGGVDPDKSDIYGRTPLWWAAWSWNTGVLKILLGRDDVNPDKPDVYGQTPRSCATSGGHAGLAALHQPSICDPQPGLGRWGAGPLTRFDYG